MSLAICIYLLVRLFLLRLQIGACEPKQMRLSMQFSLNEVSIVGKTYLIHDIRISTYKTMHFFYQMILLQ